MYSTTMVSYALTEFSKQNNIQLVAAAYLNNVLNLMGYSVVFVIGKSMFFGEVVTK